MVASLEAFDMLEPYTVKIVRAVLKGLGGSDATWLPGSIWRAVALGSRHSPQSEYLLQRKRAPSDPALCLAVLLCLTRAAGDRRPRFCAGAGSPQALPGILHSQTAACIQHRSWFSYFVAAHNDILERHMPRFSDIEPKDDLLLGLAQ
jgi:hypothetical protein